MSKIYLVLIFILCLISGSSFADQFDNAFFRKHLMIKSYPLDSDANAVVLYEKGEVHVNPTGGGYNQVLHFRRIVHILKATSQSIGDIRRVYPNNSHNDIFTSHVRGATYNMEDGKMVVTQLDEKASYDKKIDANYHEFAIAMPAVKEGSIIDVEFEVVTHLYFVLPSWDFESTEPKLISEFELSAPNTFQFSTTKRGNLSFTQYDNMKEVQQKKATAYEVKSTGVEKRYTVLWGRKNLKAIKREPFISDVENFREILYLQISGQHGYDFSTAWKEYDQDLRESRSFGKQITAANNFLANVVDSLTGKEDASLKKAKNIFNYVRNNFECSRYDMGYGNKELSEIFTNRKGSDAEINLLLIAMLRKAGITALPVQLSRVGNARAIENYPLVSMFNYVVCLAKIDGEQYYLDATDKYNRFGTLPPYCYNGYARVMDDESYGVTLTPKSVTAKDNYKVNVSRITDTSMNVEVTERFGAINGSKLRTDMDKEHDFLKDYVEKRLSNMYGEPYNITSSADNRKDPEKDLVIRYSFKVHRNSNDSIIYFKPGFFRFFTQNPFTAATRTLPIEFSNRTDYTYSFDMLLPADLQPDGLPPSVNAAVGGDGLMFTQNIAYDTASKMVSMVLKMAVNEVNYPVSDYESIKTFMEKVIQSRNTVITLRKSKS